MSNESLPQGNVNNNQQTSSTIPTSSPNQFWQNIQQEASSFNFNNISSPKQLLSLLNTLLTDVNQSLLSWVYTLIQKYPFVIPMLEQSSTSFTRILIVLYFKEISNDSLVSLIQNTLQFIIQHSDVPVTTYKCFYRQLALYYQFYKHKQHNNDNTVIINKEIYLKHLELLEILYQTNRKINPQVNSNNDKTKVNNTNTINEVIKNYFYFTNPQQILIKKYDFNSQLHTTNNLPNVNYGFVIAMKIYIDTYTDNDNNTINRQPAILTQVEFSKEKSTYSKNHNILEIKLTYNPCQIYIYEYKKEILGPIDVPTNTWIELKLKIEPNTSNNTTELIFELIQQSKQSRLVTNQNTTLNSYKNINTVTPISIFRYFTGKISSYLIYSIPQHNNDKLERSLLSLVTNDYNIKPNQIIANLLYEHDSNHKTQSHAKAKQKSQSTSYTSYADLSSYIILYYLPQYISYSSNRKLIHLEDLTCHYQGILIDEDELLKANGVLVYNDKTISIDELGGVNSLLPLSEIIVKYKDVLLNDDSIVFEKYLMFIFKIWLKSSYNAYAIDRENIFASLNLFIESLKLKHQITKTSILEMLFDILAIEDITMSAYIQPLLKMILNKHFLCKFESDYQLNIISAISSLIKNRTLNESFTKLLPKLFELIRVYDTNNSSLYCCNDHKQLFIQNNNIHRIHKAQSCPIKGSITNVSTLIKTILIHSDNTNMNYVQYLIDFMCIDFSPCAHNELVSIIDVLFELKAKHDDSSDSNSNNEIVNQLIDNDTLINVLLFRFSKGLVDTKAKIVKLFRRKIYSKLRERYIKGNSDVKSKCLQIFEKIFMNMEMSISNGGVFIGKNYLNKDNIYKQTLFGVDAMKRRGCSCDNISTTHKHISINREHNLRKRKYSDDELICFSKEKYMNVFYTRNSNCNSYNNTSTGNNSNLGSKGVVAIKEFREGEKVSLNSNPNESNDDNNVTPECINNNTNTSNPLLLSNEDNTQKQTIQQEQGTTVQSQDMFAMQPETNSKDKESTSNRNSTMSNKQKQKNALSTKAVKKLKFIYEAIPKGTLPLFYFTNNKEYHKVCTQLYNEYELWITNEIFKGDMNQLDHNVFNDLLSIITKTVVHSHSIELISKWCSCLQRYITSHIKECIYNGIHLFLFETLLHCTLIQKHNYTSLLNTCSSLSPSNFKSTLSKLIFTAKSLLSNMLFNASFVSLKYTTDNTNAVSYMRKDMIKHCLYFQSEFPQQLHQPLNAIITDIFNSSLLKLQETSLFIYISKALYFCISSFNTSAIPNIITNPFDFLNKLIYINNTKTWFHYELAMQLTNRIFEYIKAIAHNKMGQKMFSQLHIFTNSINKSNTQTLIPNNTIETFAKTIISSSRSKLLDDSKQLTSLFKLFVCLLCIVTIYTTENAIPLPNDVLKHYQNLFFYTLIFSIQKYDDQKDKFINILITSYILLIHFTDMNTDFDVVFVNITTLLSSLSKIAYPSKKGFISKLKPRDTLSNKSPLGRFFLFFASKMNDTYVFNDFVVENKKKFISLMHNKIIGNETVSSLIYNNYTKSVFKCCKFENVGVRYGKVFYYYKGLVNKKMPFYYKNSSLTYKNNVDECVRERIGVLTRIGTEMKKEKIINKNNIRNMYKKKKEMLFSWNSSWSDEDVFYDEHSKYKLKYKILGHLTCDFMRPLIKPILDIDYYLPNFTNFDLKILFDENKHKDGEIYSVDLNIKSIFPISSNRNNELFSFKNHSDSLTNDNDNEIIFTKLIQMYEKKSLLQFNNTNKYTLSKDTSSTLVTTSSKSKQPLNLNLVSNEYDDEDLILVSKAIQKEKQIQPYETYCCMVKHVYHIPGKLILNTAITFEPISKNNNTNNEEFHNYIKHPMNYDFERQTCFGSVFTSSKKDNDHATFTISFTDIKLIFKRNYFYQSNSLEIYTYQNKCIFIKFSSNDERNSFLDKLISNIRCSHLNDVTLQDIKIQGRSKDPFALDANDTIGYYLSNTIHSHSTVFVSSGNDLHRKWSRYDISTFAFIMWTNLLGNRSYVDVNQYPVFPWVIQDYLSDKISLTDEYLRNLKLPIGLVIPPNNRERALQRKVSFIEIYNIMLKELRQELEIEEEEDEDNKNDEHNKTPMSDEMKMKTKNEEVFAYVSKHKIKLNFESIPYFFGSHFSNALYINHYLMRLFPYASALIELQGNKFDDPQRLFHNLHLTFSSATGQKSDVRELCPEFFYFNQMFININNFNFGKAIDITTTNENAQYVIDNVQLPKWTDNNAGVFIETQRTILEEICTRDIHEWVDLMFGSKQTGHKARKHQNIYIPYSYEGVIKLNEYNDKTLQMHLRLAEMGLCPIKVYYNEVKERGKPPIRTDLFKETTFKQLGKTVSFTSSKDNKSNAHSKDKPIPVYYTYDNDSSNDSKCLYVVFSDLSRGKIDIIKNTHNEIVINATVCYKSPLYFNSNNDKHFLQKLASCHNNTSKYPHAYAVYNKGEVLVVGGFWDGSLIMLTKENKVEYILNPSYSSLHKRPSYLEPTNDIQIQPSPITFICINSNNTVAYCGNANGHILLFSIQNKTQWMFKQTQHAHETAIKYITINTNLQMLASIGEDNYVFIYTLPSLRVTSSLHFAYTNYIPDYVFLSSSPVPCFALYSTVNSEFKVYDINSNYMASLRDDNGNIISPFVYTSNINFKDYLIYTNDKAEIVVRSFPFMINENAGSITVKNVNRGRFMCLQKDGKGIIVVGNDLTISLISSYDDM